MQESNIWFVTNTFNYGGEYSGTTKNKFKESKGNETFFRQVMDYDALCKLRARPEMHNSFNSNYYTANINQIHVLDPEFLSVTVGRREIDPIIAEENKRNDTIYGYKENNDYYPLIEEIIIDNKTITYADEILGKWINNKVDSNDGNPAGIYIKQKIETDKNENHISAKDTGFESIEDNDPYYYHYRETAKGKKFEPAKFDKVKAYEEKYGSIFRIFEDVSQEEIIKAPEDQFTFVNAGPGTGKTYTLLKKVTYMVDKLEIDPEEILILCFTNAAVNEIKARIKKYADAEGDRSFINIDVRTFHSFSWLLISQANDVFQDRSDYRYIDISKLDYDKSIREATKIIRKYGDEVFGGCKHLIVDEIQDLTNERASLVISMVKECIKNGVGFTVLGDSCQAIYDYSDEDTLIEVKSDRFYRYLFEELFDVGKFYKLDKNHRQNSNLIENTYFLREAILQEKSDDIRKIITLLGQRFGGVVKGPLSVKILPRELSKIQQDGTTCLMCRNNAQVLATSSNLRKRGIKHIVNAYNEFEYLSKWIGCVFGTYTKDNIDYEEFARSIYKNKLSIDAEQTWIRLQELIGSENNVFKVKDILSVVAKSKVDDPIFRNVQTGSLIVSNVHKAKGREYNTVILEKSFVDRLINDTLFSKGEKTYLQEAKVLYVAVTRPREHLYFNKLASADVSLTKVKTGRKRWVRGDGRNLKTIEIRALTDADIESFKDVDVQRYIVENVNDGDEIALVMDNRSMTVGYNIVHISEKGERIIGRATDDLIEDIDAIITPYNSPWPKRISDLYVSGVHSYIANNCENVWCWVDFCGLGLAHNGAY